MGYSWDEFKSDMSDLNPFKPRDEGEYAGVDRANFDVPGAEARTDRLLGKMGRAAPQAADSAFRADQAALVDRLRRQSLGQDSLSALQARQLGDRNIAQAQGFAATARPGGAQAAQLVASQQASLLNAGVAGQAAMAGVAERNAAAGQLAGVLGQARQQDLGLNQFNVGANLQQQGIAQGWGQQELQNAQLQFQGGMGYEGNRTARAGAQMQNPTWGEQLVGAGLGGAQAYAMMARGGVVTKPTRAIIGEAGPEAVIPLRTEPDAYMAAMEQLRGGPSAIGVEGEGDPTSGTVTVPQPTAIYPTDQPLDERVAYMRGQYDAGRHAKNVETPGGGFGRTKARKPLTPLTHLMTQAEWTAYLRGQAAGGNK